MTKLNILDKILIRWGIQTANYQKYVKQIQRMLDAEHYFTTVGHLKIINNMSYYTYEEAIDVAANYGLAEEIKYLMDHGFTPDEALREWDCLPENSILTPPEFDGAGFTEADNY